MYGSDLRRVILDSSELGDLLANESAACSRSGTTDVGFCAAGSLATEVCKILIMKSVKALLLIISSSSGILALDVLQGLVIYQHSPSILNYREALLVHASSDLPVERKQVWHKF